MLRIYTLQSETDILYDLYKMQKYSEQTILNALAGNGRNFFTTSISELEIVVGIRFGGCENIQYCKFDNIISLLSQLREYKMFTKSSDDFTRVTQTVPSGGYKQYFLIDDKGNRIYCRSKKDADSLLESIQKNNAGTLLVVEGTQWA